MKVLLIIPPFTQLNAPYPSVTKLAGFLNSKGYEVESYDLSLEVFRALFSRNGLTRMFGDITKIPKDDASQRFHALKEQYINTIDFVIEFLDGSKPENFRKILSEGFLPKNEAFTRDTDLYKAFGELGEFDKAKHFASLYIEDITNFIKTNISPNFGLSRYAEKIATSAPEFGPMLEEMDNESNIVAQLISELTIDKCEDFLPDVIGYTIPFPGNLLGAMISTNAARLVNRYTTIIYGGGYINTELRNLKDPDIFLLANFLTLDEGELPFLNILRYIELQDDMFLVRTFRQNYETEAVEYIDKGFPKFLNYNDTSAPFLKGITPERYISLTELLNPMHRIWSDGYWNKLTLAHGCYWAKCTFCDVNLDYIGRYSPAKAETIVDWIEEMVKTSGRNTFHFTDEAAPPALLRGVSLEIIKRKLNVTWWGNIRFEKAFTPELCKLMAAAGCIAVSGGLEVADDRLLKLIDKGVTVEQVAHSCFNFQNSGIMVHAYLMYGFPTQTDLETINSLEYVRQFMAAGLINSGFWHLFTLTEHSPVAADPAKYKISITSRRNNPFANNDLIHKDKKNPDHEKFSHGLKVAIYNFMNGVGLDWDVRDWFEFDLPKTTIASEAVVDMLKRNPGGKIKPESQAIWLGTKPIVKKTKKNIRVIIHGVEAAGEYNFPPPVWDIVQKLLTKIGNGEEITYNTFITPLQEIPEFSDFETTSDWQEFRSEFLLFV